MEPKHATLLAIYVVQHVFAIINTLIKKYIYCILYVIDYDDLIMSCSLVANALWLTMTTQEVVLSLIVLLIPLCWPN